MSIQARLGGRWSWLIAPAAMILFGVLLQEARAQATATAFVPSGISVFAASSEIEPDYGPQRNYGFVLGGDLIRRTRWIDVAVEPRFGETSGPTVGQKYFLGMLRFSRAIGPRHRIHPYGGAGIGYGLFKYEHGGYVDNSTVYALNAGADVTVHGPIGVKVDWQYQFWDLGEETNGFNPQGISVGLVYRIGSLPFGHGH
jgi:opacity protein-like surface antigen